MKKKKPKRSSRRSRGVGTAKRLEPVSAASILEIQCRLWELQTGITVTKTKNAYRFTFRPAKCKKKP